MVSSCDDRGWWWPGVSRRLRSLALGLALGIRHHASAVRSHQSAALGDRTSVGEALPGALQTEPATLLEGAQAARCGDKV
jgi:hypothetical protein